MNKNSKNLTPSPQNTTPAAIPTTVGLRLRKLRTDAGMTQEELALDLFDAGHKVGASDISKYECDARLPSTEVLCWLCQKKFKTSADYILFGKQETAPMPHLTTSMEASILALADEIRACREGK